jgi:hypothetical protein
MYAATIPIDVNHLSDYLDLIYSDSVLYIQAHCPMV